MKYKALKGFTGIISMSEGEVRDLKETLHVKDLKDAGLIEIVKPPKKVEAKKADTKEK